MKGVGVFLDKNSATILMFTRLYHVAGTCRGFHEVYDLKYLEALEQDQRERWVAYHCIWRYVSQL